MVKNRKVYIYVCIQMYMLVSNTSTLVLLAKVGCLEKFIEISPIIEIPMQVKKEALFERDSYYAILTDDGELIKLCKLQEVQFICAMAIIIRLCERKKLSKQETLNKLEELYKIGRYSEKLYEYFKAEVK